MAVNSNAIATVTIQDQDVLVPNFGILAQRAAATVTFPSSNAVQYSGYQQVTSNVGVNLLPVATGVSFVYIKNANQSGSNVLVLTLTPVLSGSSITINLSPGGIFLWANTVVAGTAPVNAWGSVVYAAFTSAPVIMEYLFAY